MSKVYLNIGFEYDQDGFPEDISYTSETLVPRTHEYFLDFTNADLERLESAAADCLSGLNFAHPSQSAQIDKDNLSPIIECLEAIHPIYKYARSTALMEINHAFVRRIAYRLNRECQEPVDQEIFRSLVKSVCDEMYIREGCLDEYLPYAMRERTVTNYEVEGPIFSELEEAQRTMKMLIYIVFDCTNNQFASVPVEKRAAVYCATLFHSAYGPLLSISSEMLIIPPADVGVLAARVDFAGSDDPEAEFCVRLMDAAEQGDAAPDTLVAMMNAAKLNKDDLVIETFDTSNIHKLFSYEIMTMIKDQIRVKRCKYCNGYFVIEKPRVEYCNRIIEGETKPCKVIGKTRVYQKKIGEDEPVALYWRAYKTRFARIDAGHLSRGEFSTWSAEASEKLAQVKAGELDLDDFKAWIDLTK